MLMWVLLIILILLALGALPPMGWHSYGYYPSGLGLLLVIILLILIFR